MRVLKVISLFIAAILLFSVAGCSCKKEKVPETGTPIDTGEALALAERFCPVFFLKAEGLLEENYEPASVEMFVDSAVFLTAEDIAFSLKATIQAMKEYFSSSYYLDVPDLSPSVASLLDYKALYDSAKQETFSSTVYARVIEQSDSGYTVLQYWTFYYFNDWRNIHEGDWELVQLVFPGLPIADILEQNTEPLSAAYSQHQAGQQMTWPAMKEQGIIDGTHASVYVAQGSHANYFSPGQYWSILDFDDTGLSSWREVRPENIVLLQEEDSADAPEWLGFQGRWGETLGFSISIRGLTFGQSGPNGPNWSGEGKKSGKWANPYAWASGLPEYPEPFWASFIPEWAKKASNLAIFSVFSPADIHIYDSAGRHVGLNAKGELELGIDGAEYLIIENTGYKTIVIPGGDISQEYKMVLKGTGEGTMDVAANIPDARNNSRSFTKYTDVPVTSVMTARLDFEPDWMAVAVVPGKPSIRDAKTSLKIDINGDNLFEGEIRPGEKNVISIEPVELPEIPQLSDITPLPTKTETPTPPVTIPEVTLTPTETVTPPPLEFRLDIKIEGSGQVITSDNVSVYKEGEITLISAVPDAGWAFNGWGGDVSGNETAVKLIMDGDKVITAVFKPVELEAVLDQVNDPLIPFNLLSIGLRQKARQTFIPRLPVLEAVEVFLTTYNTAADSAVNMNILGKDGDVLGSASITLKADIDSWVKFSFKEGIPVTPGNTYTIEIYTNSDGFFRWKYAGNTYHYGTALADFYFNLFGDFYFRTWGSGSTDGLNSGVNTAQ